MAEKTEEQTPAAVKKTRKAAAPKSEATQEKVTIKRSRTRVYEASSTTPAKKAAPARKTAAKKAPVKKAPVTTTAVTVSKAHPEINYAEVDKIILKYVALSVGAGTIPVPIVDAILITGLQVKMVSELSEVYGVTFSENVVKSIIASLMGSLAPLEIARGVLGTAAKHFPGAGSLIAAALVPTLAGASTYAVGRVFVKHFDSNGELLNFNLEKLKGFYNEQYAKGKSTVKDLIGDKIFAKAS